MLEFEKHIKAFTYICSNYDTPKTVSAYLNNNKILIINFKQKLPLDFVVIFANSPICLLIYASVHGITSFLACTAE